MINSHAADKSEADKSKMLDMEKELGNPKFSSSLWGAGGGGCCGKNRR